MAERSLTGVFKGSVGATLAAVALAVTAGGPLGTPALQAQAPPDNLEARHQRLLRLFELNGVVFTDADETRGRLVVGVLNRGLERSIRARLAALDVPSDSVDVVETDAVVPMTTLRDHQFSMVGGLQIRFSQYLCSLGFNATLTGTVAARRTGPKRAGLAGSDVSGFVTASHCSTNQGAVDGTDYYQPLNQIPDEFIGTEIADPAFFKNKNDCPRGRRCRYSDANFSEGASGVDFQLGQIAKTTGPNTGLLTIEGAFTILGRTRRDVDSPGVPPETIGESVHKVGRTTGWTNGELTYTCANTGVAGTNIVLLCQNFVYSNTTAAVVGGGDSGSNVFTVNDSGTNEVTLRGVLWGGNTQGTMFVYSPLANVEKELGPLTVCAIGYGC